MKCLLSSLKFCLGTKHRQKKLEKHIEKPWLRWIEQNEKELRRDGIPD